MAFRPASYDTKLGYTSQDDRNVAGVFARQGVRTMTDLVASAGSGFTSAVAAGMAGVPNTFASQGGTYVVRNDGPVSVLHPNPDGTNPRVDTIIVKVYDSNDGGDASDAVLPIVVPGVATSGANLTNLTGLASLASYQNYIPVAYVLVPAGAASAASFTYLDRRPKSAGFTSIAAVESRTNTAYGTLTTPDQVNQLVVPANALVEVFYQATWQEAVAQAGRAAIFIGANQLKVATESGNTAVTQAATTGSGGSSSQDKALGSCSIGLVSSGGDYSTGDVNTGQVVGFATQAATTAIEFAGAFSRATPAAAVAMAGPCSIFGLPAGTYDISVQFKASSGSVTAKNRKLWVRVRDFNNCMV